MQPIVGKLRKRLILDLSCSIGLGIALGYTYWYGINLPSIRRRDDFYMRLAREKQEEAA